MSSMLWNGMEIKGALEWGSILKTQPTDVLNGSTNEQILVQEEQNVLQGEQKRVPMNIMSCREPTMVQEVQISFYNYI